MANNTPKGQFGTPFKKGRSGNPKGAPKTPAEVKALAREYTPDAIKALYKEMTSAKASSANRITAAIALLDRGWGRPRQEVEVSGHGGGPLVLADLLGAATATPSEDEA